MAEFFAALFGTPIPNILIGVALFLLTFSVLFKITGGLKSPKIIDRKKVYQPGFVLGLLLIGMWLFYPFIIKFQSTATDTPTPTVTATNTPEPATATVFPTATTQPSATFSESPTLTGFGDFLPTHTITPTVTATITITNTPSPTKALTIKEHGCIFASTWQVASPGYMTENPDNRGCLSLDGVGITADKFGTFHLRRTAKNIPLTAGIYTPIGTRSIIEFKVFVKSFYIINTETPATINFAVAPVSDPFNASNSARFKLSVDTAVIKPYIYFVLADLGEANGSKVTTQHYEYQHTYSIRIELTGAIIRVYINGTQMVKDLSVPAGQKVFLISYNLPTLADADIQISDIQVDGVDK